MSDFDESKWQKKERQAGGQAIYWFPETRSITLPEALGDTILRDHELAQSHSKGMAILAGEVHETRARVAELEAESAEHLEGLREAESELRQIKDECDAAIEANVAAEAEAAALRAKVAELETALAEFRELPWRAETPATAGEG